MATANDVAAGLADWLNNSETRNHGMEPGPVANMMTKISTRMMQRYGTIAEAFWKRVFGWLAELTERGKTYDKDHGERQEDRVDGHAAEADQEQGLPARLFHEDERDHGHEDVYDADAHGRVSGVLGR